MAVKIAEKYQYPDMENLLFEYAQYLIQAGKILETIDVFHKSNINNMSAQWLLQLAKGQATKAQKDYLLLKQIYVLAGLEFKKWKIKNKGKEVSPNR